MLISYNKHSSSNNDNEANIQGNSVHCFDVPRIDHTGWHMLALRSSQLLLIRSCHLCSQLLAHQVTESRTKRISAIEGTEKLFLRISENMKTTGKYTYV